VKRPFLVTATAVVAMVASTVGAQGKTFTDQSKTFSFAYPALPSLSVSSGAAPSASLWSRESTAPGKVLANATLSGSFESKTNFADAVFTVGMSADPQAVASCLAISNGDSVVKGAATINGVAFTKFVFNDAGAGNFYELHSYRTVQNKRCYAVEYYIHSLHIGNFGPGSRIVAFDKAKIQNVLTGMVLSFKFLS